MANTSQTFTLEDARQSNAAALTRTQVAEILEVDPRTITGAIANGELPSIHIGRRVLIPRQRFLEMFAAGQEQPVVADEERKRCERTGQ